MSKVVTRSGPVNIMISSTVNDLRQYREETSRIIKDVGQRKKIVLPEVSMEANTSDGKAMRAISKSKEWVDKSDWIVVIVGFYYGYISDEAGAEGLSVTEWEYRHAHQARERGGHKNVFVFMAGDDNHKGAMGKYRAATREKEPLGDWYRKEKDLQHEMLEAFKSNLRKNNQVKFFCNIDDFCEQLERTLEEAVDDLLPPVAPGGALASVLAEVSPEFADCIERVGYLADAKRVHDKLHKILHMVVRRMKDELLPDWKREQNLGETTRNSMIARWSDAREWLGGLQTLQERFEERDRNETLENTALLESIKELREGHDPLWNPEAEEAPEVTEFEDRLDEFADSARFAFRTADDEMARHEGVLTRLYDKLMISISQATAEQRLDARQQRQLDEDLEQIRGRKDMLNATLKTHHAWQDIHDRFQVVECFRGAGDQFMKRIRAFSRNEIKALKALLDEEIERARRGAASAAEAEAASGDSLTEAATLLALVTEFELACGGDTAENQTIDAFDRIVSLFEEMFYRIDERTLEEVERSRRRVNAFRKVLEPLAARKPSAA